MHPKLELWKTKLEMLRDDHRAQSGLINALVVGGITAVIGLVIVLSLWPTLTAQTATASGDANSTAAQTAILELIPLVFVAGLILSVVTFMIVRRNFG